MRCFIESCLSYSGASKKEMLTALEHWERFPLSSTKNEVDAFIPLHLDLCEQPRLLLNGVEMRIRLIRNETSYFLQATDNLKKYKVSLEKVSLFARKVKPPPHMLLDHAQKLKTSNALYPIRRVWMKSYIIQQGITSDVVQNCFMGTLPRRIIVGLVKSKAFNADLTEDPFYFKPFAISELSLDIDGRQEPTVAYKPDFSKQMVRREYFNLLESTLGSCLDKDTNGITLEDYLKGKTFFAFSISDFSTSDDSTLPKQQGNINLRLRFAEALTENVNLILYAEFENQIEVDSTRSVYTDYSV